MPRKTSKRHWKDRPYRTRETHIYGAVLTSLEGLLIGPQMGFKAVDKSGSWPISRVLSRAVIHLGCLSPDTSSNLPGSNMGHAKDPYSVLLQVGFTLPTSLPMPRCALTAPFHPYFGTFIGQSHQNYEAVYFLWHFPSVYLPRRYLAPSPFGARTFLPACAERLPGQLPPRDYSNTVSITIALSICLRG